MKLKLLFIVLIATLVSCEAQDDSQLTTEVVITPNRIPEGFIGEYKHHLGEEVTGTISITDNSIIINTSDVNYDIDITSPEVKLRPWCDDKILDITFVQCKKKVILRINNFLNASEYTNYITLSKDYNIVGQFDPIIPVQNVPNNN